MGKKARLVGTRAAAVSLALMLAAGSAPINVLAKEVRDEAVVNAVLEDGAVRAMSAKASRKKLTKELFTNGDVSKGTTEGWTITNTERGELDVANVKELGAKGREDVSEDDTCIWVKNRETCGAGAQQDVSGKLEVGKTYTFKGKIMYKDGPDTKTFHLEIQNGPNYKWRHQILRVDAKKGEWTEFEGTYKIPEFVNTQNENCEFTADQNYVFFETPWAQKPSKDEDLMDFYVDDVSMTEETGDTEIAENGSVEDGITGWTAYEHEERTGDDRVGVEETSDAHSGKSAVKAVNRKHTNDGPGQVYEDTFKEGYTYNFSAWVKQDQVDSKTLSMTIRKGKGETFTTLASAEAKKGEWVKLEGTYTFGENDDLSPVSLFFETPWKSDANTTEEDLIDITVDDLSIVEKALDEDAGKDYRTSDIKAKLEVSKDEVQGVINNELEAKLSLDKLEKADYKNLKVKVRIPSIMSVDDVEFNKDAIDGDATYTVDGDRLVIEVKGDDIGFDAEDGLFATLKLKLNGYVRKDTAVELATESAHIDGGKEKFYEVKEAKASVNLKFLNTGAIAKQLGYSNPLVTQELGADPYALVYNDRVYVYMTSDDYEYNADGSLKKNSFDYIKTLRVISSSDMVNWTDHGEIKVAGKDGAAKEWANHSWAPAIAHKKINGKDKFFLYFANDASGIGVIEGDTPIGPWRDPIKKALITRATPGCAGVTWCFDPAVLVDDDGSAYIYFGGGVPNDGRNGENNNPHTARVAKLGDDMISIEGEAVEIDAPAMFEDSGIFKYGDKYYYSYCSNFIGPHKAGYPGTGNIAYMTSDSPMGPFEYVGEIFDNPQTWFGVGGNNHHATFVFRGKSYFIYHAQTVAKEYNKAQGYRSTHIDALELDEDGMIKPVKGTYEGISQLESLDPYKKIEAETIAWNKGIKVANIDDFHRELTDLDDGDWTSVAGADFGEAGADTFKARVKSEKGGSIEVRVDSPEGSLLGTLEVPAGTEEYTELSTDITNITGKRNVFLVFKGEGTELMKLDSYVFEGEGHTGDLTPDPSPEIPEDPTPETPDQPTPDDPTPVTPDDPTPDDPTPTTPDDPTPDKPTPETPTPDAPTPETPAPETPDKPAPETPDKPAPETPDTPTPDAPTPETPAPETPDQPAPAKPEDTTKPASEPAAKASAGNGKSSTADQIAAPGDTTTLASAESGNVTINFGAKKVVLKGDKGTFKVVSGKGVKISKNGKITFKKGASEVVIGYKVEGKDVTKSLRIQAPEMEKKAAGKVSEAVALELKGTDISTAVWSTNKLKDAKISVSKDGKHVSVTCAKKGTLKVSAEINGKKYTTKVTLK